MGKGTGTVSMVHLGRGMVSMSHLGMSTPHSFIQIKNIKGSELVVCFHLSGGYVRINLTCGFGGRTVI